MSKGRIAVIGVLAIVIMFALFGCGGNADNSSGNAPSSGESVVAVTEVVEQEASDKIADAVDEKASADDLVGNWKDITDEARFVNITKTDAGYEYEDNEGKLPSEFSEGILKVKVSDTETADVYIDTASGHLFLVYQDNISEFEKK